MDWFNDFAAQHDANYPWMVKFEDSAGKVKELQISGDDAQSIADYVREVEGATTIYFIAKLDDRWN